MTITAPTLRPNSINHADAMEYVIAFDMVQSVYWKDGEQAALDTANELISKFHADHPNDEELRSDQLAWFRGLEMGLIYATEGPKFVSRTVTLDETRDRFASNAN